MEHPTLSLIVPMYNESANLDRLVEACRLVLAETGVSWELLLVDDGSTDDTPDRVHALIACDARVRYYRHPQRLGKTQALATGFDHAQGDYIFTLDADLQENPSAIPLMLAQLESGLDMVVGWRRVRRDPVSKRIASRLFNAFVRFRTGLPLHDLNCGFKGMRREVMVALRPWLVRDFHRYLPLIAYRLGYSVGEIEVEHRPRLHGRSRYGLERYGHAIADWRALQRALKDLSKAPRSDG